MPQVFLFLVRPIYEPSRGHIFLCKKLLINLLKIKINDNKGFADGAAVAGGSPAAAGKHAARQPLSSGGGERNVGSLKVEFKFSKWFVDLEVWKTYISNWPR